MQWLKSLGVYVAALGGAIIGIFAVLPFGLVVHELVILPLALFVGALLATIGASWASDRLWGDQSRTRVLPVVASAATGAALAALIIVALYLADAARPANALPPPGAIGIAVSLVLALDVALAVRRFRVARRAAAGQGRLLLVLLGLAVVSVPAVIAIAAIFGLTGA